MRDRRRSSACPPPDEMPRVGRGPACARTEPSTWPSETTPVVRALDLPVETLRSSLGVFSLGDFAARKRHPNPMTRRVDPWLFGIAFALVAVIAGTFALFSYLPMVDLPQHAAQLSAWIHLDDPNYGFAEQFEINW